MSDFDLLLDFCVAEVIVMRPTHQFFFYQLLRRNGCFCDFILKSYQNMNANPWSMPSVAFPSMVSNLLVGGNGLTNNLIIQATNFEGLAP